MAMRTGGPLRVQPQPRQGPEQPSPAPLWPRCAPAWPPGRSDVRRRRTGGPGRWAAPDRSGRGPRNRPDPGSRHPTCTERSRVRGSTRRGSATGSVVKRVHDWTAASQRRDSSTASSTSRRSSTVNRVTPGCDSAAQIALADGGFGRLDAAEEDDQQIRDHLRLGQGISTGAQIRDGRAGRHGPLPLAGRASRTPRTPRPRPGPSPGPPGRR